VSVIGSAACPTCGAGGTPPPEYWGGRTERQGVVVTGLDIPFWNLVWLLVKVSIASIPAAFILIVMYAALVGFVEGVFEGLGSGGP
jgi:hypothetical protein